MALLPAPTLSPSPAPPHRPPPPHDNALKRRQGSGSFGECYAGTLRLESGEQRAVVLKRVKARVAGAEEMHEAEHLINVLASKAAGAAVAPFLGYARVETPVSRPARRWCPRSSSSMAAAGVQLPSWRAAARAEPVQTAAAAAASCRRRVAAAPRPRAHPLLALRRPAPPARCRWAA